MKKIISISFIALSIFLIACNEDTKVETKENEEITASGTVNEEEMEKNTGTEEESIDVKTDTSTDNAVKNSTTSSTKETSAVSTKTPVTSTNTNTNTNTKTETTTTTPTVSTKSFTITAQKWSFSPSTITVNKGDTVKLSIKSTDVDHGFFLPDFNVNETLSAGSTTSVTFVADKSGTFSFSCSKFCGSGHSDMVGTLIVK